ncbi:MAG: hypothetical protein HFJ42_07665 [Clostridia bacterium]|nr:hypothetical protein [Clostridia bacterium]
MVAKTSESISLSKVKKIYGVEIRKMPCGKYFEALQTLKDLPEDFIQQLSGDQEDFKLSEMFTVENIINLMAQLLIILPDFTFRAISVLMDIDEETLRNELTPKEVLEIVQEFWKMNELESFFAQMKPIMNKITTLIGFKEQLPSA